MKEEMIEIENISFELTTRIIEMFRPMIQLMIYKHLMDEYKRKNKL